MHESPWGGLLVCIVQAGTGWGVVLRRWCVQVVTTVISNGIPQTALELVAGSERMQLGEALPLAEQEYVGAVINRHLEAVSGPVAVENDLYPSTAAAIDNYNQVTVPGDRRGHTGYGRPKWDRWEGDD